MHSMRGLVPVGLAAVGLLLYSCGGGDGGGTGTTQGSGPQLVQWNTFQTTLTNSDVDSSVQFTSPTKAGDTIWVAVTVSDIIMAYTITVSDTQGNQYTLLDQENDGAPGYQTVAHFYAADIVGDSTTPDTITAVWPADNYKGVLAAEISGVTAAPLVGHAGNDQAGLGAGTGNVTAGPIDVPAGSVPALLLTLSMNTSGGTSDTGGSGAGGATAGAALTTVTSTWDWGVNLATFATAAVTSAESITATFNAPDTDDYVTVAAVFH